MTGEQVVTLTVGGSVLEVGRGSGSEIARVAHEPQADELRRALEKEREEPLPALAGVEGLIGGAHTVTGHVEDAKALFEAVRDGADLGTAMTGVDRLLAVVDALDREDRFEEVIRVGRALHSVVALAQRWHALLSVLRRVERAGEAVGDLASSGWALHERGTLELVAGRTREANRCLSRALELRTQAGDRAGAAATQRALQSLCELLRAQTERPPRRSGYSRRLVALLTVVFLLLGAAIGAAIAPDPPPPPEDELALRVQVTGAGTVRSQPAGIECRPRCTRRFAAGTTVALAATPDEGWEFRGWRGGGCSGTGPCAVTADGTQTVSARFARERGGVRLDLTVRGDGRVVSDPPGLDCRERCSRTLPRGTVVTLVPQDGAFRRWTGDCDTADRCRVRMDGPRTVGAQFGARVETATLTVEAPNGQVISDPAGIDCGETCSAQFPRGATVTLRAERASGQRFAGWTAPCGREPVCTFDLEDDMRVAARYEPLPEPPRLTVVPSPNGTVTSSDGLISCGTTCGAGYASGTTVTLTATPNEGFSIREWTGCDSFEADSCVVTLRQDRTVQPIFRRLPVIE